MVEDTELLEETEDVRNQSPIQTGRKTEKAILLFNNFTSDFKIEKVNTNKEDTSHNETQYFEPEMPVFNKSSTQESVAR